MSNKAEIGPPQRFLLPLSDDWQISSAAYYWKNQFGLVTVSIELNKGTTDEDIISPGFHNLAVLPEGFRPIGYTAHTAAVIKGVSTINSCYAWIYPDGRMVTQLFNTGNEVIGSISYYP